MKFYLVFCYVVQAKSNRPLRREDMLEMRESVREMLNHAFNGYMKHAYPKVSHYKK
jgi:hypothetical protein